MLQGIPTASYGDPTASALCHLTITLQAKVVDPNPGNNKWYQSLLRSFDQKKNNTQVQQSLLSWPSQAQVQKMRGLSKVEARLVEFKEHEIKFYEKIRGLKRDVEFLPPPAQVYSPPKKDLSWTGLPEFVDDTVTDYSRPTLSIDASKCNTSDLQSSNFSIYEHGESSGSIMPKLMIKFVKAADCPRVIKTNNTENARKSTVKYDEMYRNISKSPKENPQNNIDDNVADLLTKPFDVGRFQYLVGEGSVNPPEPHHTPLPQEQHSPHYDSPSLSHPTTTFEPIPQALIEPLTLRRYIRRAIQIAQSKALSHAADEPASLSRDDRQGDVFPTGSMQQRIHELMEHCTSLQRQQSQMAAKIKDRDQEISKLKERVKFLEDKERRNKSTKLGSNDTEEMVNVLSSMDAANILSSGGAPASVSTTDVLPTVGVPTVSGGFPLSPIIGAKDKGKEKVVESEVPMKRKLQEQIDAQVAREMEEEFARENQRVSEQLARDYEISRLHAEEKLNMMIEGLDRSNEVIAKHLKEYEQAEADLFVGEKLELISELVKYQDHRVKILKYQAQQSKPLSKKEQREFYMAVLRSHARWKTKHFRGMTLEKIKEKFIPIWKQLEDFTPMSSKEKGERVKRQGLKIDQGSSKKMKTFEDVSEEELKGMMQLVPLKGVYVEALQVKHLIIDWEIHSEGKREYWKIIRLGGHTAVYQFITLQTALDEELIEGSFPGEFVRFILYRTPWPIKGVLRSE
uniref:Uncharacterized protein n=1 Tax=Tanacetum cinerariifolium TaxID=118510 RepID=A0A6L2L185_TANCI|nr:hypothetical protein [Tanacetum cinerariifolium]